jgi:hypothetical protein
MIDDQTIIFIKTNLTGLHYFVGIISFLFGISPLFLDREKVKKQANVIYIEISAAVFLLFSVSMISLDYISGKPLFEEKSCVKLKKTYLKKIPFKELVRYNVGVNYIKDMNNNYYLIYNQNSKSYSSLPIGQDYKYIKKSCY